MPSFESGGIIFGDSLGEPSYLEVADFAIPLAASSGQFVIVRGVLSIPKARYEIPDFSAPVEQENWLRTVGHSLLEEFVTAFTQSNIAKSEAKARWSGMFGSRIL